MAFKLLIILSCALLLVPVDSRRIKFKDCGSSAEVKEIDVDPCPSEPCKFKKNSIVTAVTKGKFGKDAEGGSLKATVDLGGIEVEYPGIESDVCKIVECPMRKGNDFELKINIHVEDYFPSVDTVMKWKAEGTNGEGILLCVTIDVGIDE